MKKPPNEIYLQLQEEECTVDRCPCNDINGEGLTWCEDRIHDTDVKYVLASEYETLQKMYRDATDALYHSTVKYWALADELSMLRSRIHRWNT